MNAAAADYRRAVTHAPTADEVELVGDEELGGEDAPDHRSAVANPASLLTPAQRAALREVIEDRAGDRDGRDRGPGPRPGDGAGDRAGAGVRFDEPMRRHTTLKIGG